MATGQIKLPQNTDIKMNVIENSGAYSDSALLTILRNSSLIQSRQIEAFLVPFTVMDSGTSKVLSPTMDKTIFVEDLA